MLQNTDVYMCLLTKLKNNNMVLQDRRLYNANFAESKMFVMFNKNIDFVTYREKFRDISWKCLILRIQSSNTVRTVIYLCPC